jgi:hypothetical protein
MAYVQPELGTYGEGAAASLAESERIAKKIQLWAQRHTLKWRLLARIK